MTMKRMVNFLCLLLVWAAASSQEAFLRKDYVSDRGDVTLSFAGAGNF